MSPQLLYSEVEDALRASVRALLEAKAPPASVLARAESGEPYDPALWRALAGDLGAAGLAVPGEFGGSSASRAARTSGEDIADRAGESETGDGDETRVAGRATPGGSADASSWREAAVVAEELGRSVAGTTYLGSAGLASAALLACATRAPAAHTTAAETIVADPPGAGARARDDTAAPDAGTEAAGRLLTTLASGAGTAALAVAATARPNGAFPGDVRWDGSALRGTVRSVIDAGTADVLLVPALDPSGTPVLVAAAVDSAARAREPVTSLDLTRPIVDLHLDAAPGTSIATGDTARSAVNAALTAGCVLLAAEQVGLAERCLELTVAYLKTRHQFGRALGSFQALKHRCADMWAAIAQARAVSRYAADCLATGSPDTAVAAALAQALCGPVAVHAAEQCLQLHGGIGFTWEQPIHLYLKRAKADSLLFGTAAAHRADLAGLVGLPIA